MPKSNKVHELGFVSPDATLLNCFSAVSLILDLHSKQGIALITLLAGNNHLGEGAIFNSFNGNKAIQAKKKNYCKMKVTVYPIASI